MPTPGSPTQPPLDLLSRPEPYRFVPTGIEGAWSCLICHSLVVYNDMRQHLVWHGITNAVVIEDFIAASVRLMPR